jgi:hypothetical protein
VSRWQAAKLLLARWISRQRAEILKPNDPVVGVVSVGGAAGRLRSCYFSRKVVPAASRHGAVFANPGANMVGYTCVAVQF